MITFINAAALALLAAANLPPGVAPDATNQAPSQSRDALAQDQLASGQTRAAISQLERELAANPEDPALLINLGIAQAQLGDEEAARALFERALTSSEPTQLEIAQGDMIDSRRLARKALRMLEAGEFARQLSRRD